MSAEYVNSYKYLKQEVILVKKLIALILTLVFVLGMAGCQLHQPDFKDFREYEEDFVLVKNVLIDNNFDSNDEEPLIVDLNSQFLTINGEEISDSTIEDSVKAIYDKGFTYIEMNDDCIIFWEDETGYYGVLWSQNPKKSISRIVKDTRPGMKSRKLANEWYEIGALDVI